MQSRIKRMRGYTASIFGLAGLGLVAWTTGCGRTDAPSEAAATSQNQAAAMEQQISATGVSAPAVQAEQRTTAPAAAIPAPDVPQDAPVLADVYPTLTNGALRQARLIDLPPDILLQAEGVSVSKDELENELAQAPAHMREQMRQNAFLLLEQRVTHDLLLALARQHVEDGAGLAEDQLLQRYFENMVRTVSVTEAEIARFYDENRDLVGNAPLEQLQPRIREHLRQEKQQQIVTNHIGDLGRQISIALSAAWVEQQAPAMLDNAVDKARANGKPTFANFGADSCMPCQQMKPFREAIDRKYGDKLNVVYVHVNREQMLASRYGVRGIPHVIFFDADGTEVHAQSGFMTQEQIEEWLQRMGVTDA